MAILAPLDGPNARLSPEEFDRMCVDGEFGEAHVEMLSPGHVSYKVGQGPFHISALMLLQDELWPHLKSVGLQLVSQATIVLGELRPEPDLALVAIDPRYPRPIIAEDVRFIVEIAVTSLETDRPFEDENLRYRRYLGILDRQSDRSSDRGVPYASGRKVHDSPCGRGGGDSRCSRPPRSSDRRRRSSPLRRVSRNSVEQAASPRSDAKNGSPF